jgi:DNA repair exonuclease SbcCD nuclease subunit
LHIIYTSPISNAKIEKDALFRVFVIVFNFHHKKQKEPKEMKVQNNENIQKSLYPDKTNKNQNTQGIDFGAVLKNEVEKSSNKISEPQRLPSLSGVSPVQLKMLSSEQNGTIIDRVENLLNILAEYQQKLKDPQFSLREIEPLVKQMEKEKENMAPVLDSLVKDDGLKNILNHALVTSSLETIKFNRGDYI